MKFSFSTLGCPGWTWDDMLVTAKDLGFDGIEVRGIGNELYVPNAKPFINTNIEKTKERLNKLKLDIPCLTSSCYLFDKSKTPIDLDRWLKQEVAWSKHWDPINIKEVIDAWANKNGGAHVDSKVPEKEMFIIAVFGKDYLIAISRYVIEILGYDLKKDINEHFLLPYNNLLKT